jgi:hypothetical protein
MSTPKPARKRASAEQMAVRKIRVVQWLQAGLAYDEIAGLEQISRKRVRQIVVEALKAKEADLPQDRRRLNELRLTPALRLAARAINEGKLEGIDRLIKVIDRLDKCAPPAARRVHDENARRTRIAKLSLHLDRLQGPTTRQSGNAPEGPSNP